MVSYFLGIEGGINSRAFRCPAYFTKLIIMVEFNINNIVLARLTDIGYWHWNQHMNQHVPFRYQKPISKLKSEADAEGWHEFQLWELMRIFGPYNHPGGDECIVDCIIKFKTPAK